MTYDLIATVAVALEGGESPESVAERFGLETTVEYSEFVKGVPLAIIVGGYAADDGNFKIDFPTVSSRWEAAHKYCEDGDWGADDESVAVNVAAWKRAITVDNDGKVHEVSVDREIYTIVVHPDEPPCEAAEDGEHDWQAPHHLVGGCDTNPGVWGIGGCGVKIRSACMRCGMGRTETSPSQGEEYLYDHSTVSYEEFAYEVKL